MEEKKQIHSIDEYIASCPLELQHKLMELRKIIIKAAPELTEKISWGMPTFFLKGNVIHFAANKRHIGLYCGKRAVDRFEQKLQDYKTHNGTIQLPNERALDAEMIQDIVRFNVALNLEK